MTWSIIARDSATGQFGIAVATKFFAVGARVPHIAAGFGGVATQALVNPYYGIDGVADAARGQEPAGDRRRIAREPMTAAKAGSFTSWMRRARSRRIPARIASTGAGMSRATAFRSPATCWRAPRVLEDTAKAYAANDDLPFAQRLLAAMRAGEAAGGDKRGKQSAALLIHDKEEWSALDLRVDDHDDPLAELERLERVSRERWVHFRQIPADAAESGRHHRSRDHRCRHRGRACGRANDRKPADRHRAPARAVPRRRRPHHACGRQRRSLGGATARRSAWSANPAAARA